MVPATGRDGGGVYFADCVRSKPDKPACSHKEGHPVLRTATAVVAEECGPIPLSPASHPVRGPAHPGASASVAAGSSAVSASPESLAWAAAGAALASIGRTSTATSTSWSPPPTMTPRTGLTSP